jgi:hypothetical protein
MSSICLCTCWSRLLAALLLLLQPCIGCLTAASALLLLAGLLRLSLKHSWLSWPVVPASHVHAQRLGLQVSAAAKTASVHMSAQVYIEQQNIMQQVKC